MTAIGAQRERLLVADLALTRTAASPRPQGSDPKPAPDSRRSTVKTDPKQPVVLQKSRGSRTALRSFDEQTVISAADTRALPSVDGPRSALSVTLI
jgi:hypothetical protein